MKKFAKLMALWLTAALLLTGMAAATGIDVVEPTDAFYVADYANVLSDETETYIVDMNDRLEAKTGGQIVVVTMEFLGGQNIEEYAYTLMNEWKIGSAEQNNGVLLLLSVGEADYWAMSGSGISVALTASLLGDYLNQYLEPDFVTGNYDAGVTKTFDALLGWFGNFYDVDISTDAEDADGAADSGLLDPNASAADGSAADDPFLENDGQIQKGGIIGKIAGGFLIAVLVLAVVILLIVAIPRTVYLRRRGYHYGVFNRAFWSHRPPPPPRRPAAPRPGPGMGPRPGPGMGPRPGGMGNPGPRPGGMGRPGGLGNPGPRPGGMGRPGGLGNPGPRPGGTGRPSSVGGRPSARSSFGGSRSSGPRMGGGGRTRGGGAGRR